MSIFTDRPGTPLVALVLTIAAACGKAPSDGGQALLTTDAAQTDTRSSDVEQAIRQLRKEVAAYSSFERAQKEGYTTAITACMVHPPLGGMGVHYGKTAIIDGVVNPFTPEVLLYEPGRGGRKTFVGVEFIVPFTAWTNPSPPVLFGRTFAANQTFQVWALHVWVGRDNPSGLFADWNPRVSC